MKQGHKKENKKTMAAKPKTDIKDLIREATSGLSVTKGHLLTRATITSDPPIAPTDFKVDGQPAQNSPIRVNGQATDSDLVLINQLAPSPVDPASIYVLEAAISTQRLDSYFTAMDVSSLRNYVTEAGRGVPFMSSHRTGHGGPVELPIGKSFYGVVEADPGLPGLDRAVASAYMRRGSTSNGYNTDSLIGDIEAGILTDISIGFGFSPGSPQNQYLDRTWFQCSLDGQDWLRADPWGDDPDECRHWPGEVYNVDGKDQLCFLRVVNGILQEFSAVFAGATDGAVILKAKRAAESGLLTRSQVNLLEGAYRTRLLDRSVMTVPDLSKLARPVIKAETDTERQKRTMASKQALEQAKQEGEKLAIARLLKSIADTRALDDTEKSLVQQAMDACAAGDMDKATTCLNNLMAGIPEGTGDNTPEDYAEGDDPNAGVELTDAVDAVQMEDEETGTIEMAASSTDDGTEPDADDKSRSNNTSIISLSLTISERQQFKSIRTEVKTLRRRVKELEPFAEVGVQYRDALIEATVKSFNRAGLGDESEAYSVLAVLPVEQIQRLRESYETLAKRILGNLDASSGAPTYEGGRQTERLDPNAVYFNGNQFLQSTGDPIRSAEFEVFKAGRKS